jgi:hypothetical protein
MTDVAPDLMTNIYNAFNPFEPLPAGDPAYVDCKSVRGDEDIIDQLGNRISRSQPMTYQLYTGHRGGGKSTELRRLQQHLEQNQFFVCYFEADEEDIDTEDTEYVDILLACTRRLLRDLRTANAEPIKAWLADRASDFKDLMLTEIKLDKLDVETSLLIFSKLTASIKAEPGQRSKIREKVNPHTVTLLAALNQFIENATKTLPDGKQKLALIVDSLDRIPLVFGDGGRSNHEEIFLDRSEQLRQLKCHIVYTVPIALVYSKWANEVQTIYGDTPILPMVRVSDQAGNGLVEGMDKLKEALWKRVQPFQPNGEIGKTIFESDRALEKLCLASGGHIRELMQMAQEAANLTAQLPITERSVNRSISKLRGTYERTVDEQEWALLVRVKRLGTIVNDNECRSLLQRRCILEYRCTNGEGELETLYRVHPLVELLPRFVEEWAQVSGGKVQP